MPLELTESEREELNRRVRSQTLRAGNVRVARLILLLADGKTYTEICEALACSPATVTMWKQPFVELRLDGLHRRHRGQKPWKLTPQLEARILKWTTDRKPKDGSTHWSTRELAKELGVSHSMVARVWKRAGLKPHRLERYMASNDPDFEAKAADIIGLYLNPPQHAAIFCVDEKTAIQALDRRDRILPFSPGRAERHGFEYYRHGTLSLFAALNTQTGEVVGTTAPRHTSEQFVDFLTTVVDSQPERREIHIIADNLSAHKTKRVQSFLT